MNEADRAVDAPSKSKSTLEFANISAANLFKIDLDTLDAQLSRQQFLPLIKSTAELYETTSARHELALNVLRV